MPTCPLNDLDHALRHAQSLGLARLDAQRLLLHALGRSDQDRAWLLAHADDALLPATAKRFNALVERRQSGEPMGYLLGSQAFFGLALQVDARVLVPRPDTETLVQWALDLGGAATPTHLLDLGTGSGAVALAIKSQRPDWHVTATDASADALAVASANAQRLGLALRLRSGHWLQAVPGERFNLIVSNPPYIALGDPHLPRLQHEPAQALTAGADGLDDLRAIVAAAPNALQPGAWLLLEHGHDQAQAVRVLLQVHGLEHTQSRRDLAGIERCSGGQWPIPG